ncbi:ALP1-like protein isoform X1 [Tanacetum coccineum]|uniref:ALP1-like protein isoform X1 n=1 Tax=Tanacetum coccineum TaxID=301880 RepID=A0ABQ5EPW2_9ASTR
MNSFFAMNPNDGNEERQLDSFEVDDETNVYFLQQAYEYHELRPNATGRMSLNVIMKCTSVIRQLAYDNTPNALDEYLQMTGANNDINVLDNSSLFNDLLDDEAYVAPFVVNGVGYEKGYYLADIIYLQWATFIKSFTVANDSKPSYFKKRQESARKEVERAFGVLQGCWGIQQPARQYHVNSIRRIMYSCIILHNMILEDQKMAVTDWNDVYANPSKNMQRTWVERCEVQRRKAKELRDRETHISLPQNLIEHIWHEVEHEDENEDF